MIDDVIARVRAVGPGDEDALALADEVETLRAQRDALHEHAEAMASAVDGWDTEVAAPQTFSLRGSRDAYRADPRLAALRGEP